MCFLTLSCSEVAPTKPLQGHSLKSRGFRSHSPPFSIITKDSILRPRPSFLRIYFFSVLQYLLRLALLRSTTDKRASRAAAHDKKRKERKKGRVIVLAR